MSNEKIGKIGYLVSRYPAVSHTFIMREIQELRSHGLDISVASINAAEPSVDKLPPEEKKEAEQNFYIKEAGIREAARSFLTLSLSNPIGVLSAFFSALFLGGTDLRKVLYYIFYFGEALILVRWMQREKISHLHVHFANPAASVALLASKISSISYSLTIHGPDEFYDVIGQRLQEKIAGARFICCISYFAQSQLMKITPPEQWPKFEIAPLGVDPSLYTPSKNKTDNRVEIVCVGRLVPAKGQQILISAANTLIKQGLDFHITFIGDGPERQQLEQAANQRNLQKYTTFKGSLSQSDVLASYQKADIFVLPSFAEGIPVSLMEAMSMEIPCLATYINGIPELIQNEVQGILTYPSDVENLAYALSELIKNSDLRDQLGKAARQKIVEDYNLQTNVDHLAKIFQQRLSHD